MRPCLISSLIISFLCAYMAFASYRSGTNNTPEEESSLFLHRWKKEDEMLVPETPLLQQQQQQAIPLPLGPKSTKNKQQHAGNHHNDALAQQTHELYGWTPMTYPNPLQDPIRCGTAYLYDDGFINNNNSSATTNHSSSSIPRLCDPDWVLGGAVLEEIGEALHNFSETFAEEEDTSWDVLVQHHHDDDLKRRRLLRNTKVQQQSSSSLGTNSIQVVQKAFRFPTQWFNHGDDDDDKDKAYVLPPMELAVATVRKMNLAAVLREGSYYTYEDEDDMVNDAAQLFARRLHDAWWQSSPECQPGNICAEFGILIFLSITDRVCFISTGAGIATILPWWRLEHVVSEMKPDLRVRDYGASILAAIDSLSRLLQAGPPTMQDRLHDFMQRFGVVIGFAIFTFFFGAYGEYRDRRKRWEYAEHRSQLITKTDKDAARQLQSRYHTRSCPICLESFLVTTASVDHPEEDNVTSTNSSTTTSGSMKRVDSFGIPLKGNDGRPVKMLRCGHIFDDSCWKQWVNSGHGNPCICPVCRQDVGGHNNKDNKASTLSSSSSTNVGSNNNNRQDQQVIGSLSHPSYDSVAQTRGETPPLWERHLRPSETDSLLGRRRGQQEAVYSNSSDYFVGSTEL